MISIYGRKRFFEVKEHYEAGKPLPFAGATTSSWILSMTCARRPDHSRSNRRCLLMAQGTRLSAMPC